MKQLQDAVTLLRLPFFVFLLPIYLFSLLHIDSFDFWEAVLIFYILHFFIYPASNGYNSYYDRDEGSIGGLKSPPKVNPVLYRLVLALDVSSILLSLLISPIFAGLMIAYILASKAYSYDGIRLKKYPIISTIVVTFFQGAFLYLSIQYGLGVEATSTALYSNKNLGLAAFCTLFLAGSYPITQIYQHEEDAERGDKTLSLLLGVWGTFYFSIFCFSAAFTLLGFIYLDLGYWQRFLFILISASPVVLHLSKWMMDVKKDPEQVNFERTMKMSMLSSLGFNLIFGLLLSFS